MQFLRYSKPRFSGVLSLTDLWVLMHKMKDIDLPVNLELATNFSWARSIHCKYRQRSISYVVTCVKPIKAFSLVKYGNKKAFGQAVDLYARAKGLSDSEKNTLLKKRPSLNKVKEVIHKRARRNDRTLLQEDLAYMNEKLHL